MGERSVCSRIRNKSERGTKVVRKTENLAMPQNTEQESWKEEMGEVSMSQTPKRCAHLGEKSRVPSKGRAKPRPPLSRRVTDRVKGDRKRHQLVCCYLNYARERQ